MTEIKVSQRAREAAATLARATYLDDDHPTVQAFARFEQAIRADEREMAAKVAENTNAPQPENILQASIVKSIYAHGQRIAATIRAQGDEA